MTKALEIKNLPMLENRMLNILRTYRIPAEDVNRQYKAALNRMIDKGIVEKKNHEYRLSFAARLYFATKN